MIRASRRAEEIQKLSTAKRKARSKNVSKYHKRYWEDIGYIFVALVMANGKDMAKPLLHKKGPSGKYYPKTASTSHRTRIRKKATK